MGMTLGLSMDNNVTISIFPRWNFLLYGMNQLINHIDKFKVMCGNSINPKIIIRTGIGSKRPLHPQYQHIGDFSEAIQKMCTTIEVVKLKEPEDIFPAYKKAYERKDGVNTILVEYGDYYNEKVMIITKTPYRISFFGGSDYPQWYNHNNGQVLSATINKHIYITCRFLPSFLNISIE